MFSQQTLVCRGNVIYKNAMATLRTLAKSLEMKAGPQGSPRAIHTQEHRNLNNSEQQIRSIPASVLQYSQSKLDEVSGSYPYQYNCQHSHQDSHGG